MGAADKRHVTAREEIQRMFQSSGLQANQFRAAVWRPQSEQVTEQVGEKPTAKDEQVTEQVTGEVGTKPESQPESLEDRVLFILKTQPASKAEISTLLGQKEVSDHLNKTMRDLLAAQTIEYTRPDKPNSRLQKYRLTDLGQALLDKPKK